MVKRYVRKTKDFSKPCPVCEKKLDFNIVNRGFNNYYQSNEYTIEYDCSNNCELSFEQQYERIRTNDSIIYYEVEDV